MSDISSLGRKDQGWVGYIYKVEEKWIRVGSDIYQVEE